MNKILVCEQLTQEISKYYDDFQSSGKLTCEDLARFNQGVEKMIVALEPLIDLIRNQLCETGGVYARFSPSIPYKCLAEMVYICLENEDLFKEDFLIKIGNILLATHDEHGKYFSEGENMSIFIFHDYIASYLDFYDYLKKYLSKNKVRL